MPCPDVETVAPLVVLVDSGADRRVAGIAPVRLQREEELVACGDERRPVPTGRLARDSGGRRRFGLESMVFVEGRARHPRARIAQVVGSRTQ